MTVLVSSAKINKATVSLNQSPSTTSSKYTGILKSINLCVALTKKISGISQASHSCINLDKIIVWSSFHCRLVPRFKIDKDNNRDLIFFISGVKSAQIFGPIEDIVSDP